MPQPERPVPPPLEGDDRLITAVITAGWLVALVVLLIVRSHLAPADRWWIWVPALGTAMGIFGLIYVPHLKKSRERTATRRRLSREGRADLGVGSVVDGPVVNGSAGHGSAGHGSATASAPGPDAAQGPPPGRA